MERAAQDRAKAEAARPGVLVETTLMFGDAERVEPEQLRAKLNTAAMGLGERFETVADTPDGVCLFASGDHFVSFEQHSVPADETPFSAALAYPLMPILFSNAAQVVREHTEHVVIRVGGGDGTSDDETLTLVDHMPKAMLPKLRLAKVAAGVYARERFPLALHWAASDNLMAGPNFTQILSEGPELDLFVKATPFSSGESVMERPVVGAVTLGALGVCGREVEIAEGPVPMAWALDRAAQFVDLASKGLPPHGATVRFAADELLMVHHEPASVRFPAGHVRLTAEKLPERLLPSMETPPLDAHASVVTEAAPMPELAGRAKPAFGRRN